VLGRALPELSVPTPLGRPPGPLRSAPPSGSQQRSRHARWRGLSPRTRALVCGAAVLALAAGAGGVVFALQGGHGTETSSKADNIGRANANCRELGRESLDDCAERSDAEHQAEEAARQEVTVDQLQAGDCLNDLLYPDATGVPCGAAHQEEIVAVLVAPEGPYPGAELLVEAFAPECEARGADYIGGDRTLKQELFVIPEVPFDGVEWDVYGRTIVCSVSPILKEPLEESVRSSGT